MGKSLSKNRSSHRAEPAWDNPKEAAQYLRDNGFPDVKLRWCEIDPCARRLQVPSPDGVAIAVAGEDVDLGEMRIASTRRRIAFAKKYHKSNSILKTREIEIRPDKLNSEEVMTKAAQKIGIAPQWILNGSTFVRKVDSKGENDYSESSEVHSTPEFIRHYVALLNAASYAGELAKWYDDAIDPVEVSDQGSDADLVQTVKLACLIAVRFRRGQFNSQRKYKLEPGGELDFDANADLVPYFPFVIPMLREMRKRPKVITVDQEYDLRITGAERTAILMGLGLLGCQTGVFSGDPALDYLSRNNGNPGHVSMLQHLHRKVLALWGQEKASPFSKKGKAGRPRKVKN
jgi:hypothetical protein